MTSLSQPMLASYWIPAVGIGKPEQWVKVPLSWRETVSRITKAGRMDTPQKFNKAD